MVKCIQYNSGYKYQLKKEYIIPLAIRPENDITTEYVELTKDGILSIKKGYAWDGPSGPTIDTKTFMRGSLVHDALYQLMRIQPKQFPKEIFREQADNILKTICIEDGMWHLRAWWVHLGVLWFADPAADPSSERPPQNAPNGCI